MFECGSDGLKKECELFQKIILGGASKSLFSEFILTKHAGKINVHKMMYGGSLQGLANFDPRHTKRGIMKP